MTDVIKLTGEMSLRYHNKDTRNTWSFLVASSCGVSVNYSMSGTTTSAKTISITEFYNNTELGQANIGQTFTNLLKTYIIQNSSISVVQDEGELQMEGEITDYQADSNCTDSHWRPK